MNFEDNKVAVVLTSKDNSITVLGADLDKVELWDEIDECNFRHIINSDIELTMTGSMYDIQYTYRIDHSGNYKIHFVNVETNEKITEEMEAFEFIQRINSMNNIKVLTKHIDDTSMALECIILNRKIKINMIRLLSLYKPKYTLTITISKL